MTNAEILAAVRGLIDDPDGAFSPAGELALHLEDVARDFAKRSRVMRKQKAVMLTTSGKLTLPEDCNELIKVLDASNREIYPASQDDLSGRYGSDWEAQAGNPVYYTRDLTGVDAIRFSHKPTTAIPLTLTYHQGHVIGQPIEIPSRFHLSLVWGTAARAIAKSTNPADEPNKAQFASAYEAGVQDAANDAAKSFSSHPRAIPYRHF